MGKRKVSFPAIGSDHPVPAFLPPERGKDEDDASFERRTLFYTERAGIICRVRMVKRERVRDWEMRLRQVVADEQRREKDAGESYAGFSDEGTNVLIARNKEIVFEACAAVEGLQIGEHDLEDRGIPPELRVELVSGANLLAAIADACERGQFPTPKQLDSSGS